MNFFIYEGKYVTILGPTCYALHIYPLLVSLCRNMGPLFLLCVALFFWFLFLLPRNPGVPKSRGLFPFVSFLCPPRNPEPPESRGWSLCLMFLYSLSLDSGVSKSRGVLCFLNPGTSEYRG